MRDSARSAPSMMSLRRAMTSSIFVGSNASLPSSAFVRRAAHTLVYEPQAVEREREVDFVYELGRGRDERGEPAGRDDARAAPELFNHAAQYAVYETGVA